MSKVVSLRLKDEQVQRLNRTARRFGRTASETAALLLEEALRQDEFAFLEFRDSAGGRHACVKGSRLTVWQIISLARSFAGDAERVAEHLDVPVVWIRAALAYAAAYPTEIDAAIADNDLDGEQLRRLIPGMTVVGVDALPA